jgi:hypothetical protein
MKLKLLRRYSARCVTTREVQSNVKIMDEKKDFLGAKEKRRGILFDFR